MLCTLEERELRPGGLSEVSCVRGRLLCGWFGSGALCFVCLNLEPVSEFGGSVVGSGLRGIWVLKEGRLVLGFLTCCPWS